MFGRCVYDGALFHVHTGSVSSSGEGGTITASIQYQSDGDIVSSTTNGNVTEGLWVTPAALAPGAYTIRVHVDSGTLSAGTEDTDLALTSNRTWTVSQADVGSSSATLTFTLKDGSGNTVASGQMTLSATRNA